MHPVLYRIGPLTVYSYGAFVAIGFAVFAFLAERRARAMKIDSGKILDLAILILVSGIVGSRIMYVVLNLSYYAANPAELIDLSKGGLVWYGGLFAAFFAGSIYVKINKMDLWDTLDLIAPYLALGQSLGRIGCFFNGCCYGSNGAPVQLYSSAALLAIFIALRLWQDARKFKGEIFLGYCMLYSVKRFAIEFLRADNPRMLAGLTISQVISVFVFILASVIFIKRMVIWKETNTDSR